MALAPKKAATINLRIDATQLAMIDKAIALQKKDRTSFILDLAYQEAINVVLDRRLYLLDEDGFNRFESILNSAPRDLPALKALLLKKAPWEK